MSRLPVWRLVSSSTVPLAVVPQWFLLGAAVSVWLSFVVSLAFWVYRDLATRGSGRPLAVALLTVGTPIGLPYYLRHRRNLGERSRPATRVERAAGAWAVACLVAVFGGVLLAPPDPFSQVRIFLAGFLLALPVAYLLVYRRLYREVPWLE